MEKTKENEAGLKDVEIAWVFDAPIERVWRVFTDPEIEKLCPNLVPLECTDVEFLEHDFREGGKFFFKEENPWIGRTQFMTGTYKKIVPLKELVYTASFADEKGNIVSGAKYGINVYIPLEMQVEITFEPVKYGTKIRLIHRGLPTAEGHRDMAATVIANWLVKLSTFVEKPNELVVGPNDVDLVWLFDSPVEKVWKAFTDPEIKKQWYGPSASTGQDFLEHDFRVGGTYTFRVDTPGQGVHFNTGTFKKIVPLKELVYTQTHKSDYSLDDYGKFVRKKDSDIPDEHLVMIRFEKFQEDGTKIRVIHKRGPSKYGDIAFNEWAKSLVRLMKVIGDPWV